MPNKKKNGFTLVELVVATGIAGIGALVLVQVVGTFNNKLIRMQSSVNLERVRFEVRTGFNCQATFPTAANCVAGAVDVRRTNGTILIPAAGIQLRPGYWVRAICSAPREIRFDVTRVAVPAATDWAALFSLPEKCGLNP